MVGIGRHARAARQLPDLRGDRRVAAVGGGGGVTSTRPRTGDRPPEQRQQDAETAAAARGMAVERRSRGPWAGMGQPAEKPLDFGPSVRRLLRLLPPGAARRARGAWLLGRAQRRAERGRPADPRRGHRPDLRRVRRGPEASGGPGGQRDRLRARCGRVLLGRVALYLRRVGLRLAAGLPAQRDRPAHDLRPAPRRRGTSCTGCRCATSTASSAARCSAGSPTTSTTSRRACSRP